MILDRVTITGADDSVRVSELQMLSERYPFVEWGILFSKKRQGTTRYPSDEWLAELYAQTRAAYSDVRCRWAAHLCGHWVRNICAGDREWFRRFLYIEPLFSRVQLNFHGERHELMGQVLPMPKQYILQVDGVNNDWVKTLCAPAGDGRNTFVPLFDQSGGAGVSPGEWPTAWPGVYSGYAGGLGPDNIEAELARIAQAAGPARVWIDMEANVRVVDGLDLGKVEAVLQACATAVKEPTL